jgi:acetyl-CoA carboxylase biotin carboxyl carrier protein
MIDLKTLRELVKIMVSNDLTEVDLQDDKGEKVSLKRAVGGTPVTHYASAPVQQVSAAPAAAPSAPVAAAAPAAPKADDFAGLVAINSPMVGTFYASPSPEAKPFVAVGAKISAEKNVCIIEAMKVFNEIKAETSGTIEKVMVTSGQAVEFGQPLFYVRPG